jgi:hypothetical protein
MQNLIPGIRNTTKSNIIKLLKRKLKYWELNLTQSNQTFITFKWKIKYY